MDQLKKLIAALSIGQRIMISAMAILVPAGIAGLVHWKHEGDFRPLFTGMAPEDAGSVVQKIKESGVEYRLSDNGTAVLVPKSRVDEVRLQLASLGLPKSGRVGFEIFDRSNLGITDFTEQVNYRRALEGELERSVRALSQVQQARVHITFPKSSVFLEEREPAKASVVVDLRPGASLTPQNVAALTNLVASAVEGLSPSSVTVVDYRGNLLNKPHTGLQDGAQISDAALEYEHQIEKDLSSKVESTLEPLLGPGKFRVGISVACDFTTTEQSDDIYDPSRSVMANSQRSEDYSQSTPTAGVPGTQSNSPRPAPKPATPPATGLSRRTENVAYDTTRTVRHVTIPQGAIKRISASVLIDQPLEWQGTGKNRKRVPVPMPTEKMNAIHELVAGALGFVKDRDQLVLESLPFEQTWADAGTDAPAPSASAPANSGRDLLADNRVAIGAGVGLAVAIGVVAVVFLKSRRKMVQAVVAQQQLPATSTPDIAATPATQTAAGVQSLPANHQLPPVAKKVELIRDRLRENVKADPVFAANVLRGWLEDDAR